MRFLLGAELGRAAPTRTVRDDGRMSDVRRCSARGAQHGSATVGERLKGSFACSASMNGVALMQPSGVPPTPPNPRSPEGFRNPAQPAPEPMPWAGFSLGAEARGCAPKTSHSARAPRRLFLKRAADVDRGRSPEAPRGVARMAPDSREKLAGAWLHEDGGRARADRAGDRAPAAAGADEIDPARAQRPGDNSVRSSSCHV